MALTKISTEGVKDDAITKAKIPADQIEASELADNSVDSAALSADCVIGSKIADSQIATEHIADQAVSLDKLPHGTGSNDGKFLRANNGADPSYETVSSDFGSQNVATTGTISDGKGNIRSISSNAQGGAYVAVAADAGKAIYISTGGVTINDSVFSAGDAITIINNSGSNQTITQGSGVTLYNTGDATTGNRTLAGRGMSTIWFASASVAYISGSGLS